MFSLYITRCYSLTINLVKLFIENRFLFLKNVVHMFHMRTSDSFTSNMGYLESIAKYWLQSGIGEHLS